MVLNVQDRKDQKPAPSTETSTTVLPEPPATPGAMPAPGWGLDPDWTDAVPAGHRGADPGTLPPPATEQTFA
jgi:hypothetical protein